MSNRITLLIMLLGVAYCYTIAYEQYNRLNNIIELSLESQRQTEFVKAFKALKYNDVIMEGGE